MDHSPGFLKLATEAKTRIQEISIEQAQARLKQNPKAVLIDVREYNACIEYGAEQKPQMLPRRIKPHFACGSHERMPTQNDNSLSSFLSYFFQALAQFQFFSGEQFIAEAANFSERRCVTKNK